MYGTEMLSCRLHSFLLFVPRAFPCRGLLRELLDRPDPAVPETLRGERRELDLSDVEPRSVLRGEVDLEPFRVAPRRGGRELLVKGRDAVGVEAVHHQDDLLGVRVRALEEGGNEIRPLLFGPRLPDLGMPVAPLGARPP